MLYPVQIQADNEDARQSGASVMCHVFDVRSEICMLAALQKQYMHVVAWNPNADETFVYDNR